jgi:signal transduction histidine kinase
MRPRSLTRPALGLYAVKTLLVTAIFVSLLLSLDALERDTTSARNATSLLVMALRAERSALDLSSGLTNYLASGSPAALARYRTARSALPAELGDLSAWAQAKPITADVERFERSVADPALRSASSMSRAEVSALVARQAPIVLDLRARFGRLETALTALRRRRRAAVNSVVDRALVIAGIGLALSLLLEVGVATFLLRRVLEPIRFVAQAAVRLARGEMDVRVPRTGAGEVELLSGSFNTMATAIQARTTELAGAQERLARAVALAEDASAMKSNFVANMSHEIRTPLNGLVGMLSLLAETRLDEDQRKYVEVALSSGDALMAVVNDVLDIAKIEAGRLDLEQFEFDLHDAVESICELMAAAAWSKQLELQPFIRADVPQRVRGDRTRITQILQNLVSNAIKFTAEGEVALEVSLVERDPDAARVRFEVRDSGMGIEPERIGHLFEPFTQAEAGTTRKFGGTGLGLAISRELTQLMGGTISGESALGQGSTFSFEIPFEVVGGAPAAPPRPPELEGVRVLIVDDNAGTRRVLESYAAGWGMRPLSVAGAYNALVALRGGVRAGDPFPVALLDQHLGDDNGLDLARQITADPEIRFTRLVLMTSSAAGRVDDPAYGISGRVGKPIKRARLLAALSEEVGAAGSVADAAEEQDEVPAGVRSGRVLVAEDHDVNWMLIERMLAGRGHEAIRAIDGDHVLELVEHDSFDLVFMDCQMPRRDGFDATRELRERERRQGDGRGGGTSVPHLPVVAMTAGALAGTRERCLEAGMDDYMVKPISAERLDEILARYLGEAVGPGATESVSPSASPAVSPGAEEPVVARRPMPARVDPTRLAELRRVFPGDELQRMVDEMREEVARDLAELQAAIDERDQARAASAAHRIRNTARAIGGHALADAAEPFDHPPRPGRPPLSFDGLTLDELHEVWQATRSELTALVGAGA